MKLHRALPFGSIVLIALALSTSVPGQEKKPLTFGTELSLVAVPVFVTDKEGKRA